MKLYNSTKNNLIAGDVKLADNFIKRSIGLLSRTFLNEDEGLIIKPCCSIHTFFMRFEIDALFVNRENCVVALYENIKKNKIVPFHLSSWYVVELPAGTISQKNIEKYDILDVTK